MLCVILWCLSVFCYQVIVCDLELHSKSDLGKVTAKQSYMVEQAVLILQLTQTLFVSPSSLHVQLSEGSGMKFQIKTE